MYTIQLVTGHPSIIRPREAPCNPDRDNWTSSPRLLELKPEAVNIEAGVKEPHWPGARAMSASLFPSPLEDFPSKDFYHKLVKIVEIEK